MEGQDKEEREGRERDKIIKSPNLCREQGKGAVNKEHVWGPFYVSASGFKSETLEWKGYFGSSTWRRSKVSIVTRREYWEIQPAKAARKRCVHTGTWNIRGIRFPSWRKWKRMVRIPRTEKSVQSRTVHPCSACSGHLIVLRTQMELEVLKAALSSSVYGRVLA